MSPQRVRLLALSGGMLLVLLSYLLPLIAVVVFVLAWIGSVSSFVYRFTSSHPGRHWRALNVLARLFGFGVLAVGGVMSAEFTLLGVPIVAFGMLLLSVPPYRPDLGDAALSDRTMRLVWGLPKNWRKPQPRADHARRTGDPIGV